MICITLRLVQSTHGAFVVRAKNMRFDAVFAFYFRIGTVLANTQFAHIGQTAGIGRSAFLQAVIRVFRREIDGAVNATDCAFSLFFTSLTAYRFTQ